MRIRAFALCVVFGVTPSLWASVGSASSPVEVTRQSGHWTALHGLTERGRDTCGLGTFSATTKSTVVVRYVSGQGFSVVLDKGDWDAGETKAVEVSIQFDQHAAWKGKAVGHDGGLVLLVDDDVVVSFLRQFRSSAMMSVHAEGLDTESWAVSLEGSLGALDAMNECISILAEQERRGENGGDDRQRASPDFGTGRGYILPGAQPHRLYRT